MSTALGLLIGAAGALLLWSAIVDRDPREEVRAALTGVPYVAGRGRPDLTDEEAESIPRGVRPGTKGTDG